MRLLEHRKEEKQRSGRTKKRVQGGGERESEGKEEEFFLVRDEMGEQIAGAEPKGWHLHRKAATAATVAVASAPVDTDDFNEMGREFIRGREFSDSMLCRFALCSASQLAASRSVWYCTCGSTVTRTLCTRVWRRGAR